MGRYVEIPILSAARRCGIRLDDRTLERREVQGYCPFCQGTRNHLFLNTGTNQWYCQKCGRGGNVVTLYATVLEVDIFVKLGTTFFNKNRHLLLKVLIWHDIIFSSLYKS